ncbi:hypothetical protein ACED34_25620, partial [Vibrio splendidus]|uniref:hypothetical protein n=1 Tax=Vibrio splendidus TaxID=29497 RepID=UPI00352BFFB6
ALHSGFFMTWSDYNREPKRHYVLVVAFHFNKASTNPTTYFNSLSAFYLVESKYAWSSCFNK